MAKYNELKGAGLPDDAAACVAGALDKTKDIVGENPAIDVERMYHLNGSPVYPLELSLVITGEDGSQVSLQKDGGGYSPPRDDHKPTPEEVAKENAETTQKADKVRAAFHPCQKFFP